ATTSQKYYLPILNNFKNKKCLLKFTVVYDEGLPEFSKNYLRHIKKIIVSNQEHQVFLKKLINSHNIVVQDIPIANEKNLLLNKATGEYTFGILCRFSQEKRIE